MRLPAFCRIATPVLSLAMFAATGSAQSPIGIFDSQTDIGRPRKRGIRVVRARDDSSTWSPAPVRTCGATGTTFTSCGSE